MRFRFSRRRRASFPISEDDPASEPESESDSDMTLDGSSVLGRTGVFPFDPRSEAGVDDLEPSCIFTRAEGVEDDWSSLRLRPFGVTEECGLCFGGLEPMSAADDAWTIRGLRGAEEASLVEDAGGGSFFEATRVTVTVDLAGVGPSPKKESIGSRVVLDSSSRGVWRCSDKQGICTKRYQAPSNRIQICWTKTRTSCKR